MREIALSDITGEEASAEASALIDMLRTKYPKLDLRRGTVLRDLLVDADGAVGAMYRAQAAEQRESSSLLRLAERSEAGEAVDSDDVDAALSNFNMAATAGSRASGRIRIVVSTADNHTVLRGVRFQTSDGFGFVTTSDTTASMKPSDDEETQHEGIDTFWFTVPVEAEEAGAAGNIGQGTALESDLAIADFVTASAYSTFSGGSDMEPVNEVVGRVKQSLAARSLTTSASVEAMLRDRFDSTGNPIVAVSVCGYGNSAQLRDKHNPFGVSVGGRADVYVRNFRGLPVSDIGEREWERTGEGSYRMAIPHSLVPGMAFIRSVSDGGSDSLSSYPHEEAWSGDIGSVGWHDVNASPDPREFANSVWRDVVVDISEVPEDDGGPTDGRTFATEVVALPAAGEIQDFLDDGLVRNVSADYVVRCPMIVNVSVSATVRHDRSVMFDVDAAREAVCSYVNSTGFQGRLTRSEISNVLMGLGASSVDLFDESEMLHGYVYDALGRRHDLSGDALDIALVSDPGAMLTPDTCVFVAEIDSVSIRTLQEDR